MKLTLPDWFIKAMQNRKCKSEVIRDSRAWRDEDFEHTDLNAADFPMMREIAERYEDGSPADARKAKAIVRRLAAVDAISKGAQVNKLEPLTDALREYIKSLPHGWVFVDDSSTGESVPYLVTAVDYYQAESGQDYYRPAYILVDARAIRRGDHTDVSLSFYKDAVIGGVTAKRALIDRDWIPETEESVAAYEQTMQTYVAMKNKTGQQYVASGNGVSSSSNYWHSKSDVISLEAEKAPTKVVLDDDEEWEDNSHVMKKPKLIKSKRRGYDDDDDDVDVKSEDELVRLPEHPYVRCFSLKQHLFVVTHVDNLSEYIFDRRIFDKLVLDDDIKEMIDALVQSGRTATTDDDMIAGKGRGVIILSSGPPGTGKTLTAESYSERARLPLYSIQCSQLGTDGEELEKKLAEFLTRCIKWNAIGLIDEADVFIREREKDIQQNAVVGVFLRLLEYYRGVLFMTTNRETAVDDAILSRCVVHVRYRIPSADKMKRVWAIMSEQFNTPMSEKLIASLVSEFPHASPRTAKQMTRVAKIVAERSKKELNLDLFKFVATFQDAQEKSKKGD